MPVPLLDMSRQHAPLKDACARVFSEIYASGRFILGDEVTAFESELADYTQTAEAIGMSSGTDALLAAMMVLGIGPGDEVLCPVFTFFGTAGSIARVGAIPVWVDVLPETFNIDLADAERKITKKTKAIVPVHLFGQACEMECVMALAEQHGLHVIEDAAQAIGARYKKQPVGSIGTLGALSFYPTKNLGGFGDGGALVTQDAELAERARRIRNHGMHPRYHHREVGGNFRLDALQAGLLRIKLPHLEHYHAARRRHAAHYRSHLSDLPKLVLPRERGERRHVWNQYTIRVLDGQRDHFQQFLQARGIGSEIYYPISLDRQECFNGMGRGGETIHAAHELARSVVSIPVFPELREDELEEVVAVIREWHEQA